MRIFNKLIVFVFLVLLTLSSCQKKHTQEEIAAINSFLDKNYSLNEKVLHSQQEEYKTKTIEKPETYSKILDTAYTKYKKLTATIKSSLTAKTVDLKTIINEYNHFLDELEVIVHNDTDYTINRISIIEDAVQLDTEYTLRILQNNLVMAMSYAFEYVNNPPSTLKAAITKLNHVTTTITKLPNGVQMILSSALLQTVHKNTHVTVDRILLNGTAIHTTPRISQNEAFATIVLDAVERGKYYIQGKLLFYEDEDVFKIPFLQKFEVR